MLSEELRELGIEARRGQQFSGGKDSPDVIQDLPYHIECKFTQRFNLYEAYEQAVRDCKGLKTPIVCHKRNRKEWMVVISLKDFITKTRPRLSK